MIKYLDHTNTTKISGDIDISGSKSESNRLLILQQLYPNLGIQNLSNSDDTKHLQKALSSTEELANIAHAGTAMRFLTALFAIQEGKTHILTGSKRMQNRPIAVLVTALQDLGATIQYAEKKGFPPLKITGRKLIHNKVSIAGNISSQYITALLLIAPKLPNGLHLKLLGEITSTPYINMTLALLHSIGVKTQWNKDEISIFPLGGIKTQTLNVAPDWSSASYFYSLVALHQNAKIKLKGFKKESLQGDSALVEIYKKLGVSTVFDTNGITLQAIKGFNPKAISLNLSNTPDLAQTIVVTCLGLGIDCSLEGLHTLKIKETDRLEALKNELEKLGAKASITASSLSLKSPKNINRNISIATYEDHRMAMAFAPLSVGVPIQIENADVVSKSYPDFWVDWDGCFVNS